MGIRVYISANSGNQKVKRIYQIRPKAKESFLFFTWKCLWYIKWWTWFCYLKWWCKYNSFIWHACTSTVEMGNLANLRYFDNRSVIWEFVWESWAGDLCYLQFYLVLSPYVNLTIRRSPGDNCPTHLQADHSSLILSWWGEGGAVNLGSLWHVTFVCLLRKLMYALMIMK